MGRISRCPCIWYSHVWTMTWLGYWRTIASGCNQVKTVTANPGSSRSKERRYTNCVVTWWYRPPELLLGVRNYGGEIDMWGVGYVYDRHCSCIALTVNLRCVLGEMFLWHPILPRNSDLDQLEKIWQMCGTPNQHTWPNFDTLPGCEGVKHHNQHPKRLKSVFEQSVTCHVLDSSFLLSTYLPFCRSPISPPSLISFPYVIHPFPFVLSPCTLLITRTRILG